MYPKKYIGLAGRFIVVCFLLFSSVFNAGYYLMDTNHALPLSERGSTTGDNKPDKEEETRLLQVSSEQVYHSPVRSRQKQGRLLRDRENGSIPQKEDNRAALLAGPGFLEKPYYYIFLFRHNLF